MVANRLPRALLGLSLLSAAPAGALDDLSGVYQGRALCEWTDSLANAREKFDVVFHVDDDGTGRERSAFVDVNQTGNVFRAAVVSAPKTPSRGRLGGPACQFAPTSGGWLFQSVVKAGAGKASLKGELIFVHAGASERLIKVCRFSAKRTSTVLPAPIPGCP